MALPERTKLQILAPVIAKKKGQHKKVFEMIQREGYVRMRVDGELYDVTEAPELSKNKKHDIETSLLTGLCQRRNPLTFI